MEYKIVFKGERNNEDFEMITSNEVYNIGSNIVLSKGRKLIVKRRVDVDENNVILYCEDE